MSDSSSISIDGLLAARVAVQTAFCQARDLIQAASAQLAPFQVGMPRLEVSFAGGEHRDLAEPDERYREEIRREIDRYFWIRLFEATNVECLMDSKTRREMQEKLHRSALDHRNREERLPELTLENIEATWGSTVARKREFFENSVEAVYRSLSWEHKTNTPGLIGQKIISRFYSYSRIGYDESLCDLERVLAVLDGQATPTHMNGLRSVRDIPFGVWYEVPGAPRSLLSVKIHRKGTVHVRITSAEHVTAMNAIMSRRYPGQVGTGDRRGGATA